MKRDWTTLLATAMAIGAIVGAILVSCTAGG